MAEGDSLQTANVKFIFSHNEGIFMGKHQNTWGLYHIIQHCAQSAGDELASAAAGMGRVGAGVGKSSQHSLGSPRASRSAAEFPSVQVCRPWEQPAGMPAVD